MANVAPSPAAFDIEIETLIIGAGAGGLTAALAAHEAGQNVLLIEADAVPQGSTALSAGLIPAAGTKLQRAAGIADSPAAFANDIQTKAHHENDPAFVEALTMQAAPTIDWLTDRFGLPFSVVDNFDYPGHSARRMHGLPTRSGAELIDRLRATAEAQDIDLMCGLRAETLFHEAGHITGVAVRGPDGAVQTVGCEKLILACNGFGGNRAMVSRHMPEIDQAVWFGHDGNRGEAVQWGEALGAATRHLGAYQGHGNVAHPHGILITWATVTEGGFQVNRHGRRFWNEAQGYSEAARVILSQPGGEAFTIFDARIADIARQFEDFRQAESQGAIRSAHSLSALEQEIGVPAGSLQQTVAELRTGVDDFGRAWPQGVQLEPPFCAVRVTGALFHTQGGLVTDATGAVQRSDGTVFANLFAVGGAACGVSGTGDSGYLSGNGLLSALTLGYLSGRAKVPDRRP
ncbi:MAG: 3-ketosteroid dehydrogenase [Alphaproteobacteria bacterium MedPE-SWcel]|nr:MAG: 3-ketosteroid dehydrogenase [Alphaproteobacteria bacterium MedPE-SWcel]